MCIDATALCFSLQQESVDLNFQHIPASRGDLLVEAFNFLAHGRIEVRSRERLTIDDDERYWRCWRTRGFSARRRRWLRHRLRLRCGYGRLACGAATFGRLCGGG